LILISSSIRILGKVSFDRCNSLESTMFDGEERSSRAFNPHNMCENAKRPNDAGAELDVASAFVNASATSFMFGTLRAEQQQPVAPAFRLRHLQEPSEAL
jgi:hypothetical protein